MKKASLPLQLLAIGATLYPSIWLLCLHITRLTDNIITFAVVLIISVPFFSKVYVTALTLVYLISMMLYILTNTNL